MRYNKTLVLGFIIGILLCSQVKADSFLIPSKEIEKQGIQYTHLDPVNLSYRGNYCVCAEPVKDIQLKAQGKVYALHVLRFEGKKLGKVDTILLPITNWVNAAVSDRQDEVCVLGNYGTKILKVDTNKLAVTTLFQHTKGSPGFKAGPFLGCYKGSFFALGWFYNAQQFWEGDYITRFQIEKGTGIQFQKAFNTEVLEKKDEGMINAWYYHSPNQVFYNFVNPVERKTSLMMYRNRAFSVIDKGFNLVIFVGNDQRVFYSVVYDEKKQVLQHFVRDLNSSKVWKIGEDNDPFTYPFMTEKGDIVVVGLNNKLRTLSAYCGREKQNYRLVKFLHNAPLGPMKVSANGKVYFLMTPEGIQIGDL